MKRLFFCILCFVVTKGFTQIRIGVEGGANVTNLWQTDAFTGLGTGLSTSPLGSWHAGVFGELDLRHNWYLQAHLQYFGVRSRLRNSQGFPPEGNYITNYSDTHLSIYYARLPVNFVYKIKTGTPLTGLLGAGVYYSQALSGKETGFSYGHENTAGSPETPRPVNNTAVISDGISSSSTGLTRIGPIDVGGSLLVGLEWKKFELTCNYSRGFSRVYRAVYANTGNTFFNFTLSYFLFGHERKPDL